NTKILMSIIKCIEFCGHQGISLRGHKDNGATCTDACNSNNGNFHAMLKMRIDAGDTVLKDHFSDCEKNATYISKTAQNQLLDCFKDYLQYEIVKEVKEQPFKPYFGVMADEVSDISNWEQLGIVNNEEPVERLLMSSECKEIAGGALCNSIIKNLKDAGLNPYCRAPCFDGAGNIAGQQRGCTARFLEHAPRAPYFHCTSHDLYLALCKACKIPEIQRMLETLKNLGTFFKFSPKWQRRLEDSVEIINKERENTEEARISRRKIKPLCETHWIEKHKALEDFEELCEAFVDCLEKTTTEVNYDAKIVSDANGFLSQITNCSFISAFHSVRYVFGYTKALSALLQGSTMDLITAYEEVKLICDDLKDTRVNVEKQFAKMFTQIRNMVPLARLEVGVPHRCKRQTLRSNVEADNPECYFRRAIFIPFLDSIIQQISLHATRALYLIPSNLHKLTQQHEQNLKSYCFTDLPSPATFHQEIRLWSLWVSYGETSPSTAQNALKHLSDSATSRLYPNICSILHVILVSPTTTATVERANSSLKFIKNKYRSTMTEGRLNALILMFVHRDIKLDVEKIIDMF
uniref:HAT C-terminal dimerisation domain-containing protein n=1 Tax=Latimeria chalumnae TaxID=7897 RepID=H3B3J7_LATCH